MKSLQLDQLKQDVMVEAGETASEIETLLDTIIRDACKMRRTFQKDGGIHGLHSFTGQVETLHELTYKLRANRKLAKVLSGEMAYSLPPRAVVDRSAFPALRVGTITASEFREGGDLAAKMKPLRHQEEPDGPDEETLERICQAEDEDNAANDEWVASGQDNAGADF